MPPNHCLGGKRWAGVWLLQVLCQPPCGRGPSGRRRSAAMTRHVVRAKPAKPRQRPARRARGGSPAPAKAPARRAASAGVRASPRGFGSMAAMRSRRRSPTRAAAAIGCSRRPRPWPRSAPPHAPRARGRNREREEIERRLGAGAVHQGVALSAAPLPGSTWARLRARARAQPRAAARPGHRPAQCRRDPALGRRLRGARRGAAGARQRRARRRARQGRLGRARRGAAGRGRQSRARPRRAGGAGFWRIALDGHAEATLDEVPHDRPRRWCSAPRAPACGAWSREHLRLAARLPIAPAVESLNVSVACGIALYALARRRCRSR